MTSALAPLCGKVSAKADGSGKRLLRRQQHQRIGRPAEIDPVAHPKAAFQRARILGRHGNGGARARRDPKLVPVAKIGRAVRP